MANIEDIRVENMDAAEKSAAVKQKIAKKVVLPKEAKPKKPKEMTAKQVLDAHKSIEKLQAAKVDAAQSSKKADDLNKIQRYLTFFPELNDKKKHPDLSSSWQEVKEYRELLEKRMNFKGSEVMSRLTFLQGMEGIKMVNSYANLGYKLDSLVAAADQNYDQYFRETWIQLMIKYNLMQGKPELQFALALMTFVKAVDAAEDRKSKGGVDSENYIPGQGLDSRKRKSEDQDYYEDI